MPARLRGARALILGRILAPILVPILVLGLLLVLLGTPSGGVPDAAAEAAPARRGWDYVIRVDEALQILDVRICFRSFRPKRFVLPMAEAASALVLNHGDATAGSLQEARNGAGYVPVGLRSNGCIAYRVNLHGLSDGRRRSAAYRVGRDLVVAPGAILLRPAVWPRDAQVTVHFELPPGLRPAVPWPRTADGDYTIDRLALRLLGRIAIGRFPPCDMQVHGTTVDIALLDARSRATIEGIQAWIGAAVGAVAGLYGRFPTPHLTALVQPTPSRGEPVLFGLSMRAGGGHVNLLLSSLAKDEELVGEWVGVHELMHLGMPWTYDQEAWLQEGFVTYYQEVLRARAGLETEQEAWQEIHDGFGRGRRRGGKRVLELESRDMAREHGWHRVYWAGAAIALLIDVELRRSSAGRLSLDDIMRLMHERYGATNKPHGGLDLLRAADRAHGRAVAAPIAERALRSRTFPDVRSTLRDLGLRVVEGRVMLDDSAPLAAVRKAIMRPAPMHPAPKRPATMPTSR